MTDPEVVLHGGFHKTATSHIQSVLNRNSKLLMRNDVFYVHHRETRKRLTVPGQLKAYENIGLRFRTQYSQDELNALTEKYFEDILSGGCRRIIISDENMAGHCGQCVKGGMLYGRRKAILTVLAGQFSLPVKEIHLSVRNYADFFAAAYVEFLRSVRGNNFIDVDNMKVSVLARMPSWNNLLSAVARRFEGSKIYVWKYEDFRQLEPVVMSNLCGAGFNVSLLKQPRNANRRPTASARAVGNILDLIQRHGLDEAMKKRVEIQKAYPKSAGYPAFDPWTQEERAHLDQTYLDDIRKILEHPDLNVLKPGSTL